MKQCPCCKQYKNRDDFHKHKIRKDGLQIYCKDCLNYKIKQSRSKNPKLTSQRSKADLLYIRHILNKIKSYNGCARCGEKEAICLDFHHPNDNKKENISKLAAWKNKKMLIEEILKCIVVCVHCHRKHHANLIDVNGFPLCVIPEDALKALNAQRKRRPIPSNEELKSINSFEKTEEILAKYKMSKNRLNRLLSNAGIDRQRKPRPPRPNNRKVARPDKLLLKQLIDSTPMTTIGKLYGVSDNAVRKWARYYEIEIPKKRWGYNAHTKPKDMEKIP